MNYHLLAAVVIVVTVIMLTVVLRITTLTAELVVAQKSLVVTGRLFAVVVVGASLVIVFGCVAIVVIASVHGSAAWLSWRCFDPRVKRRKGTATCEQSEPRPRSWFPDWERDIGLGSRTGKFPPRWRWKTR